MAVFLKIAGVDQNQEKYLNRLGVKSPSRPQQNTGLPSVQFPASPEQVPAQLNMPNQNPLFVVAARDGMVGALNLDADISDAEAMDRALDNSYVVNLQVGDQPMIVGTSRSEGNLLQLAGAVDQLKQGQAQSAQSQVSSVKIEEVPDDEAGSDTDVSLSDSDDEEARAAEASAVSGSQPQPENVAVAANMVQVEDAPAEASGSLSCLDIVCTPFRWIGALVLLPFRGIAALFRFIGGCCGL